MDKFSFKQKLGCLLLDLPRLLPSLFLPNRWISARNHNENLKVTDRGVDTRILGPYSIDLYAAHVFPRIGLKLMRHAFGKWPIRFSKTASNRGVPDITFVIPHRGIDRLPLLLSTVRSILAQCGVSIECIVVEQNHKQEVTGLPEGVRYIHLPHPHDRAGWHKSWAYNVGVKAARAAIVVCHDSDILVPCDYAREIIRHIQYNRYEVVHLQRFLFSLNIEATEKILKEESVCFEFPPDRVRQNWQGGTLAIKKDAFFKIGGYDESFIGWGGEDNEFYNRCTTLNGWYYGYLPFVHLWHEPQPEKVLPEHKSNLNRMRERLGQPPDVRIMYLKARQKLSYSDMT